MQIPDRSFALSGTARRPAPAEPLSGPDGVSHGAMADRARSMHDITVSGGAGLRERAPTRRCDRQADGSPGRLRYARTGRYVGWLTGATGPVGCLRLSRGAARKDAKYVPAIPPLFDQADLDPVVFALSPVTVLLLVTIEVCGVVPPDIVSHPPSGGDEVGRGVRRLDPQRPNNRVSPGCSLHSAASFGKSACHERLFFVLI
jgi:hypothetical protein